MRVSVDLVKQVVCALPKSFAVKVVRDTLALSGFDFSEKQVSVTVAFVSEEEIKRLNKTYRRKNKVTDILSFPEYASKNEISGSASEEIFLGDLIVCYDYLVRAAKEDGVTLEQEMAYIISHGVLHLLGFRHSKKMFFLQDTVSEVYA